MSFPHFFRFTRGYLALTMIHINGFGVKKQPPEALLSNICLVDMVVKTVPLLRCVTVCICARALQVVSQKLWSLNLMMSMWHCDSQFSKKNLGWCFFKCRYHGAAVSVLKIRCCDPSFTKSNSIWMLVYTHPLFFLKCCHSHVAIVDFWISN